ncbi:hypothetical protein TNCT_82101 [Trichonephila clavata]|uniref:Uncharacterized protein n=1 Tax=Trichonephila clavata TaxID=2740835 RepID=A0A8X6KZW2_TRICU|nr:hypothetical protein TNCT_82101 [Trichonephila clavata]
MKRNNPKPTSLTAIGRSFISLFLHATARSKWKHNGSRFGARCLRSACCGNEVCSPAAAEAISFTVLTQHSGQFVHQTIPALSLKRTSVQV